MYKDKSQLGYLPIICISIEFLFIIIIIAILAKLFSVNNITTDINSQPAVTISNLRSTIPELSPEIASTTERQLYTALLSNSPQSSILDSATNSVIVEGSVIRNNFDDVGINLISAAIDIPALEQSYSFYYGYPQEGNNDFQTFYTILCPVSNKVGSYSNFNCRNDSFVGDATKNSILSSFLSYFDFAYFSASLDATNSNRVIIRPSITYNNDQKTKDGFIEEVQDAIESLGMDPSEYEYYVRTAADINYENNDR
ncbi:hypothetical protein IKE87_02005 [Candidatus Saccharibacteria bacterium]|nr:hypothetical protein [Candidatus Saccharibacteria bacterium]